MWTDSENIAISLAISAFPCCQRFDLHTMWSTTSPSSFHREYFAYNTPLIPGRHISCLTIFNEHKTAPVHTPRGYNVMNKSAFAVRSYPRVHAPSRQVHNSLHRSYITIHDIRFQRFRVVSRKSRSSMVPTTETTARENSWKIPGHVSLPAQLYVGFPLRSYRRLACRCQGIIRRHPRGTT